MPTPEDVLNQQAAITWDTIKNAYENQISYGEDAITSVNLLSLKNQKFRNFAIVDTRIHESEKGCDFEFWVGSKSNGWNRYAIQAKKISVSSGRYDKLAHKVNGIPQIDILEKFSNLNNAIPLYCFFNHSDHQPTQLSCPKCNDIKEYGCSITPLSVVKTALNTRGARSFRWFHDQYATIPWSCLVRCPSLDSYWSQANGGYSLKENKYEKLPHHILGLLHGEYDGEEILDSELYSFETKYRPKWVGVFDTSESKNG